jgi:hypothetical protein
LPATLSPFSASRGIVGTSTTVHQVSASLGVVAANRTRGATHAAVTAFMEPLWTITLVTIDASLFFAVNALLSSLFS